MDFLAGPLMLAVAEAGHTGRFAIALDSIRNINFKDKDDEWSETALHKATKGGHKDIVQLLLGKGALTEVMNKDGNTPLHLAARGGYHTLMELLLPRLKL